MGSYLFVIASEWAAIRFRYNPEIASHPFAMTLIFYHACDLGYLAIARPKAVAISI
jgi:hypothetical protein